MNNSGSKESNEKANAVEEINEDEPKIINIKNPNPKIQSTLQRALPVTVTTKTTTTNSNSTLKNSFNSITLSTGTASPSFSASSTLTTAIKAPSAPTFDFKFSKEQDEDPEKYQKFTSTLRYFIPESERIMLKKCMFCRQPGHLVKDCKAKDVKCILCKSDHNPIKCPAAELCFRCYKMGHYRRDCPNRSVEKFCDYCDTYQHHIVECPRIWRKYELKTKNAPPVQSIVRYCYNCGRSGHFGDDCPSINFDRISAFNGIMVSRILESRERFDEKKRFSSISSNKHGESQSANKRKRDEKKNKKKKKNSTSPLNSGNQKMSKKQKRSQQESGTTSFDPVHNKKKKLKNANQNKKNKKKQKR